MKILYDAMGAAASFMKRWRPLRRAASALARRVGPLRRLYQHSIYWSSRHLQIVEERCRYASRVLPACMEQQDEARGEPRGVFVVVIDALRWRSTSLAGYERRTTPFLEKLPARGRALAAAPQTYSSVPTILTGLYPHQHGAVVGGVVKNMGRLEILKPLRSTVASLPDIACLLGMDFHFVTSITTAAIPFYGRVAAIDEPGRAEKLLTKGLRLAQRSLDAGRGFIAYIHLGDLHQPVRPPRRFRNYFGEVEHLPRIETWDYFAPESWGSPRFGRYRRNRVLLYDNTLRYVDYALERFFQSLRDIGLEDNSLVIVTADHGEEFWEHAEVEAKYFLHPYQRYGVDHGHTVFNELIEVPLVFAGPGSGRIASSLASDSPASHIDIVPTLLDWLGLGHSLSLPGHSLLRGPPPRRPLLAEAIGYGYEKKAIIEDGRKLFYAPLDGVSWVFDLELDPYETSPVDEDTGLYERRLKRLLARTTLSAAKAPCREAAMH